MIDKIPASSLPVSAPKMPFNQVMLSLLPLIALGLGITLKEIPNTSGVEEINAIGFFGPYPLVLIGLLWGWSKGFPRWVYPYLAYGVFFALYLSFASTPGFILFNIPMWGQASWGCRAFVPLAIIVAVALLITRPSWSQLDRLARDIWNDWTLLAYGLYGLLPLIIPIVQDETARSYSFPATAIAAIFMLAGAALYLGLARLGLRATFMLAGLYLSILAASVGSELYWQTHQVDLLTYDHYLIEGPISWGRILLSSITGSAIFTLILLLVPGLVGFAHWCASKQQSTL